MRPVILKPEEIECAKFARFIISRGLKDLGHNSGDDLPLGSWRDGRWVPNRLSIAKKAAKSLGGGFPDYVLGVPAHRAIDPADGSPYGRPILLVVEMKLPKGPRGGCKSDFQPWQREWIAFLNCLPDTVAIIAYGADEAIELVEKHTSKV